MAWTQCNGPLDLQDPNVDLRAAFMTAVDEYNCFGSALNNNKWKITEDAAAEMFGLKARATVACATSPTTKFRVDFKIRIEFKIPSNQCSVQ